MIKTIFSLKFLVCILTTCLIVLYFDLNKLFLLIPFALIIILYIAIYFFLGLEFAIILNNTSESQDEFIKEMIKARNNHVKSLKNI